MVGKAQMIHHNGKTSSPPVAVARNMSQVAHDVVELAELQSALVKLELSGWWKQLVFPTVLLIIAGIVALSCLPILVLSLAYGLAALTSLELGWCLLIASASCLVIAAIIGLVGWMKLKAAQAPLTESRRELSQNLRWIKSVLKQRARPSNALPEMRSPKASIN